MASPEPVFSRRSLSAYFELNCDFQGFASTRYDVTITITARAMPASAHSFRVGLKHATSAIAVASTPHPQSQSAAAEAGDKELNSPSGSFDRRKNAVPMTDPRMAHMIEVAAQRFPGLSFASLLTASAYPPPAPAINHRTRCSQGRSNFKSKRKCAGP